MTTKKIAITIGDPGGIGPEVALKALLDAEIAGICRPLLVGDRRVVEETVRALAIPLDPASLDMISTDTIAGHDFTRSAPTAAGGAASAAYIRKAAELAMLKVVDAVVTAPISKTSLKMAGLPWPGHTEMLAELTRSGDVSMMLCGGALKVILVTIHCALKDVPAKITRERVVKTIRHAQTACDMLRIDAPRIAVAGLNPHAGESGMFGNEEHTAIAPAVEEAAVSGINVTGPHPPDALFYRAYRGDFDIIVCMYHDQGLIPLKMIAFDKGVNVTIGLPIIRTSPDHGTAFDIAWQGIANPSSMKEAIRTAVALAQGRT